MEHDDFFEVDTAVYRWASVCFLAFRRKFPPVGAFDDLDVDDRSREAIDLLVDATWLRWDATVVGDVCDRYIVTEGWQPCEILLGVLDKFL